MRDGEIFVLGIFGKKQSRHQNNQNKGYDGFIKIKIHAIRHALGANQNSLNNFWIMKSCNKVQKQSTAPKNKQNLNPQRLELQIQKQQKHKHPQNHNPPQAKAKAEKENFLSIGNQNNADVSTTHAKHSR